jgi:hypothetical protein
MFHGIAKLGGSPVHKNGHTSGNNLDEGSPDDKRANKTKKSSPKKKSPQQQPKDNLHSDCAAKHAKVVSNHVLESIRYWDVTLPPIKKYMVAGTLVPSVKNALSGFSMGTLNKKRRISIELYKPTQSSSKDGASLGLLPNDHRPLHHDRKIFGKLLKGVSSLNLEDRPTLETQDIVIFRILKSQRLDVPDDDSETTSNTTFNGDLESRSIAAFSLLADNEDIQDGMNILWKERYRTKLQNMEILTSHGRTVDMKLGAGDDTVVRDIYFDNNHGAHTFVTVFQELRQLQRDAGLRLASAYGSTIKRASGMIDLSSPSSPSRLVSTPEEPEIDDDDNDNEGGDRVEKCNFVGQLLGKRGQNKQFPNNLRLLIEIVSAANLPIAGKVYREKTCFPCGDCWSSMTQVNTCIVAPLSLILRSCFCFHQMCFLAIHMFVFGMDKENGTKQIESVRL